LPKEIDALVQSVFCFLAIELSSSNRMHRRLLIFSLAAVAKMLFGPCSPDLLESLAGLQDFML
jgi:hypothetical protein